MAPQHLQCVSAGSSRPQCLPLKTGLNSPWVELRNITHFASQEAIYEVLYTVLIGVWIDFHIICLNLDPVYLRDGVIY